MKQREWERKRERRGEIAREITSENHPAFVIFQEKIEFGSRFSNVKEFELCTNYVHHVYTRIYIPKRGATVSLFDREKLFLESCKHCRIMLCINININERLMNTHELMWQGNEELRQERFWTLTIAERWFTAPSQLSTRLERLHFHLRFKYQHEIPTESHKHFWVITNW